MGTECFFLRPTKKFFPQNGEKIRGEKNSIWVDQNAHVHSAHELCLLVLASFYLFIFWLCSCPLFFHFPFSFPSNLGVFLESIAIILLKKRKKIVTILFSFSPVLASHNSFLLFPPQQFGQLNCHNSFFFFSPPQFWQLHCLNFFFSLPYNFSNSIATHNSYFSLSFLGTPPG